MKGKTFLIVLAVVIVWSGISISLMQWTDLWEHFFKISSWWAWIAPLVILFIVAMIMTDLETYRKHGVTERDLSTD